jgi:DNA-binding transcriptional LysR family regulator
LLNRKQGRVCHQCRSCGEGAGGLFRPRIAAAPGVVATIYGNVLVRRSRAALDELRHGIQEIEFLTDSATGEVRVGCPESISSAVLPAIAKLFFLRCPKAVLDVDDVNFGMLAPLVERKIDLVIARGGRGFAE